VDIEMRRVIPLLIGAVLFLFACADKEPQYERIVVVDPGHGGVDPGAIGSTRGTLEKEVALRAGLALRDQLEASGRYRVIMTRDDDRFVRLPDRLEIARRNGGELFISLHADSLITAPQISGASVYTLSEQASRAATHAVSRETGAAILAGMDSLSRNDIAAETVVDAAKRQTNSNSVALAELLVQELNGATTMIRLQPVQAGFLVLTSPEMPSVLIELGYLSNRADERALADDAHIARLATAIGRAVDAYFGAASF
jgi:N-acetylmuramoyl-L-alanine amidase